MTNSPSQAASQSDLYEQSLIKCQTMLILICTNNCTNALTCIVLSYLQYTEKLTCILVLSVYVATILQTKVSYNLFN
jgi:hypothetical protein